MPVDISFFLVFPHHETRAPSFQLRCAEPWVLLIFFTHIPTHTPIQPVCKWLGPVSKINPLSSIATVSVTSTDPHTLSPHHNLGRLTGSALKLSEPLSLPSHPHSQAGLSSSLVLQGGNSTPASGPLHELVCLFIVYLPTKNVHKRRDLYILFIYIV